MKDLTFFQRLTLFTGLFFASTTVVPDGGGDVPEGGDAGDGGGDGGQEEPTETGTDEPASEDATEIDETGAEEVDSSREEAAGGRTRPTPAQVKQALAKLKEIDPKVADFARRALYEADDFKRVFPNIRAARDAHDLLETYGGHEGIQRLEGEAKDYATELTKMSQGDPSIVEDLANDFPQSLPKLVPHALAKLQQLNDEAFQRVMAPHVAGMLRDRGVAHSVTRLIELIGDGKQKEAHELASKLDTWIKGVEEFAKTKPQQQDDESARAIREREEALNSREANLFRGQVARSVIESMNQSITKALAPMLKTHKLTAQQRSDLVNSIRGHLAKGFEGNTGYQQRMRALLEEGDARAIERYVRGQLTGDRVSRSVKAVWSLRGFSAAPRPKVGGGNGAGGDTATVATKPSADQIDWSKDPGKMRYMRGQATLKNGKQVTWKWD